MKRSYNVLLFSLVVVRVLSAQLASVPSSPEFQSTVLLFETWVKDQMEYRGLPGMSVGIVKDQELIYAKGFGYADVEKAIPATPKTIYRIASITKTFTATAIMILRDEGKLRLEDPVKKYLPWFRLKSSFPGSPEITIKHLITHTSGLPREAEFPYWTDHHFPTIDQMIKMLPEQAQIYPSETKLKYSNLGIALAGEVVASASGISYQSFVQKRILDPLGMNSSAVVPEQRHRSNMAVGYSRIFPDRSRKLMPYTDSKGLTAAANMCSSVEDFGKYIALQFRTNDTSVNQIVKGSTLAEMHRVQWLQPSWKRGWGLGFSVRKTDERVLVGHGGWVAGYKTQILFSPEEKIGMIVLINADDGDPGFFANEMFTIFAGVLRTKPVEMPKAQETDQNLRKFAGTYVDTWGWESEIMLRGNMLVMYDHSYPPEENPLEGIIELTHESGNAFRRTGTNGDGEPVIFELDKNGVVIRVNIGPNYLVPKR